MHRAHAGAAPACCSRSACSRRVAQLMLTRAYATGRTLVNASLQYLGIAWSFVYGVLLFDDKVTALAIAGMLLIAGAGLSATLLRSRNPRIAEIADSPNTV